MSEVDDGRLESLRVALQPLRDSLKLDGADIELVDVQGGTAQLDLDVSNASCAECVLPRESLESVVVVALRKADPRIAAARVRDPREEAGS
jgi:hypothetical protein